MNNKRQPPDVLYKKSVLKNFSKLTGKHLCQSLSFNKVVGLNKTSQINNQYKKSIPQKSYLRQRNHKIVGTI